MLNAMIQIGASTLDEIYTSVIEASVGRYNLNETYLKALNNELYRDRRGGRLYELTIDETFIMALESL